mmetsp:Transcript_110852/g.313688  ORF Transcript_110852/g.313688 Transcript_110852/m.313688 type:complete len:312 (+) Transcript_110852:343-1278(+)
MLEVFRLVPRVYDVDVRAQLLRALRRRPAPRLLQQGGRRLLQRGNHLRHRLLRDGAGPRQRRARRLLPQLLLLPRHHLDGVPRAGHHLRVGGRDGLRVHHEPGGPGRGAGRGPVQLRARRPVEPRGDARRAGPPRFPPHPDGARLQDLLPAQEPPGPEAAGFGAPPLGTRRGAGGRIRWRRRPSSRCEQRGVEGGEEAVGPDDPVGDHPGARHARRRPVARPGHRDGDDVLVGAIRRRHDLPGLARLRARCEVAGRGGRRPLGGARAPAGAPAAPPQLGGGGAPVRVLPQLLRRVPRRGRRQGRLCFRLLF